MERRGGSELLERENELAALGGVVGAAAAGRGGVALIEGPPGIGKSSLLAAARNLGRRAGMAVLRARGSELERGFAFGLARQLLEPAVARLRGADRAAVLGGAAGLAAGVVGAAEAEGLGTVAAGMGPTELFSMLHGLYWVCLNLSARGPLLLAVDDAHWADAPSLRWLAYVARRVDEAPIAIAITARSTAPEAPVPEIDAIRDEPHATRLMPRALSEAAAATVLERVFGEAPDAEFTSASQAASGGNPFLLIELARTMAGDSLPPRGASAGEIASVRPEAVARGVLVRLTRFPESATRLARALAVLGGAAEIREAASLAELGTDEAAAAADRLTAARILEPDRPLHFAHPVTRSTIYADLTPGERARLHRLAARQLLDDGADAERVAAHLMETEAAGEAWIAETLRSAAAEATTRGAPETTVRLLTRAIAEPPPASERAETLGELGLAEAVAGLPDAEEHLRVALAELRDPVRTVPLVQALALWLLQSGRGADADEVLRDAVLAQDGEARLALEAQRLSIWELEPALSDTAELDRLEWLANGMKGDSPAERVLLATLADRRTRRAAASARDVVELAEQALADGRLLEEQPPGSLPFAQAVITLIHADAYPRAACHLAEALARGRRQGSLTAVGQCTWLSSVLALRRGDLAEAEMHARSSLEQAERLIEASPPQVPGVSGALPIGLYPTVGVLIDALTELGRIEEARATLARFALDGELAPIPLTSYLLEPRARLSLAAGDAPGAAADAEAARERAITWGSVNPADLAWRSTAALAQLRLGERERARELAAEDLEFAERFGAPRALGITLRVRGLARADEEGLADLERAVEILEPSGATLELARALADLGAATRRARRRTEARDPLRRAAELATRCGATPLADTALAELKATGARPRRVMISGAASLTARERQIAELAAEGHSNPEIAQMLFVTRGTVEKHLESVYRKLEIGSRGELPGALEG